MIEPRRPGAAERLRELWRYRRLVPYFARRYIEKLYMRTWLGWLWLPLRPILTVGSQVLVFGALLGVPSEGVPYLIFFVVGMGAWQLFASAAYWATRSIELNRRVLTRMYVPRLAVLLASIAPSALNYLLYLAIGVLAAGYYFVADGDAHFTFGPGTLVVLPALALMVALALAIGLWTSIYGAQARDVRFGLAYVLNFWFFLTPVIYPLSAVPDGYRTLALLNPMTAPVEMVRHGFLGTGSIPLTGIAVTLGAIALLAVPGLWFFGRSEAAAVDSL